MAGFELGGRLVLKLGRFVPTFASFPDERVRAFTGSALTESLSWPEPLLALNPSCHSRANIEEAADESQLRERCSLLCCELGAGFFRLSAIARDDIGYIMDALPIVKRKDEAAHGHYRTRDTIPEIHDDLQRATETGEPYQTRLDPPPADPRVAHPPPEEVEP